MSLFKLFDDSDYIVYHYNIENQKVGNSFIVKRIEQEVCTERTSRNWKKIQNFEMSLHTILRATPQRSCAAFFQTSAVNNKSRAGRYKVTIKKNKPLTYEMACPPYQIAHIKSWNSWNTSNLIGGNRPAETAVEDIFIRRFMTGTWPLLLLSEIIIKRQFNIIRIAGILKLTGNPRQIYFLTGYSEEFLSYWLQCPVKLEIQVAKPKDVIFKYI